MGSGRVLETLPLDAYQKHSPLFEGDVYQAVDLDVCVSKRISAGGTCVAEVEKQIAYVRQMIKEK